MKTKICVVFGALGGAIATALGGWNSSLTTLVVFMIIDYLSGIAVAGIFHASTKTESGSLKSIAGAKGLCKKAVILLCVLIAYRLDLAVGTTYIREAVIIGFMSNELISIVENVGLMGVPMPTVITKAIDVLQNKSKAIEEQE